MPVTTQHPDYQEALPQWQATRDCVSGQQAVKKRKKKYLPGFSPDDKERYDAYLKRAMFLNVTGRTHKALAGAVFRRSPTIELPAQLEYANENMDGGGQSVEQVAKRLIDEGLQTGRYFLLVDYPAAPDGLTAEEVRALELQAYTHSYRAESVINWKTTVVAGRSMLSMVVLHEKAEVPVDEFTSDTQDRYRVLRLTSDGYTQTVHDREGGIVEGPFIPRKADGSVFREIPGVFYGSQDNKPDVDDVPLNDLAEANLAHYRVSADHMENLHIHGQLTLGISSDMSYEQFKEANPNGIMVGARAGHFLGESGAFTTATAPESSSLSKALEDLKADMINIGGRLIQPRTGTRTAEEARIEASSENSVLETLVGNASEALTKCLQWTAEFMGANPDDVSVEMNTEFWDTPPDAQTVAALMGLEDRGHMAPSDVRDYLRRVGLIDPERTDEEIDEDVGEDGGITRELPVNGG